MKVAIVYDWIDKWGGVERLLLTLHEMYPEAQWYTSYVDTKTAPWAKKLSIKTSFIQRLPEFIKKNRILSLILYPYAFESFDLSEYDVVISVSSSFAKGVITKPGTKHISYLLTPTRYIWGMSDEYISGWKKIIAAPFIRQLREWDFIAAQRADIIITLSEFVAKRISKYYNREAEVVYPPFNASYWESIAASQVKPASVTQESFYLVISRLEPYKKVDMVIETFSKRTDTLIIVGSGSQKSNLAQNAGKNVHFIENLTDKELVWMYSHAKALIIPQEEEFGYVALEAQYCNCPVILFSQSGTAEIIKKSDKNISFTNQTPDSLQQALERFEAVAYNGKKSEINEDNFFEQFSTKKFVEKIKQYIIG